jgi:hypothetical protein
MAAEAVAPTEVSAKVEATKEETAVAVSKNASFREESNFLADLKESERKVLAELRDKVEAAIVEGKLFDDGKPEEKKKAEAAVEKEVKEEAGTEEKKEEVESKEEAKAEEKAEEEDKTAADAEETKEEAEDKKEEAGACEKVSAATDEEKTSAIVVDQDISLWGVPLLPSKGDEATDVVLLKFLRARDFKAGAAFEMLRRTLRWRRGWKGFAGDEDGLPEELEGAFYVDGADREGHPVCYNALGVFADDAVYKKALGTEEGKAGFLRWRVRAMERHVAQLDFTPGGVSSLLQVIDLRNSPGPAKKDLRVAAKQVLDLFQDNYPELVTRNVSISIRIPSQNGWPHTCDLFHSSSMSADLDQCAVLVLRIQHPVLPVHDAEDQEQVRHCSPVQGHRGPPQVSSSRAYLSLPFLTLCVIFDKRAHS